MDINDVYYVSHVITHNVLMFNKICIVYKEEINKGCARPHADGPLWGVKCADRDTLQVCNLPNIDVFILGRMYDYIGHITSSR